MHQIKIFKGLETELPELESTVNRWLAESQVKIVNLFGNISPQSPAPGSKPASLTTGAFSPSDVMLVVLYES